MNQPQFQRGSAHLTRTRHRGAPYAYLLLLPAILVAPMILVAAKQSSYVNLGYRITELRDEIETLRADEVKLRTELARQTAPGKVLPRATSMGMAVVPAQNRITVKPPQADQPQAPKEAEGDLLAKLDHGP